MHRVAPSTIQPSTYFLTSHWPLPDSKLFLDIGSLPLCHDTCKGGNRMWIPCSNDLDKWSSYAGLLVCAMCIKLSQNISSMVQNGFTSNRVKELLHSFFTHMLVFSIPSISDIIITLSGCSGSVPTHSVSYDSTTSCNI